VISPVEVVDLDLVLVAEEYGAALAPVPVISQVVAGGLLAAAGERTNIVYLRRCARPRPVPAGPGERRLDRAARQRVHGGESGVSPP